MDTKYRVHQPEGFEQSSRWLQNNVATSIYRQASSGGFYSWASTSGLKMIAKFDARTGDNLDAIGVDCH
jgi:hypothetical protein